MTEDWLLSAADAFYSLACAGDGSVEAWRDVVLWMALQVGKRDKNTKMVQELITENYLPEVRKKFGCIYRHLSYAISQTPHQNVMLRLMERVHLSPIKYSYDEAPAQEFLLKEIGKRRDSHWVGVKGDGIWQQLGMDEYLPPLHKEPELDTSHLDWLAYLVYLDDDCIASGGSGLIALANVWRELCPADFPNRLLLIASDKFDPTFALISFIQMALMGMACYVLPDLDYVAALEHHHGLFPYITATHDVNNPRSGGVMKQLGMKYQYSYEEQWQPKDFLVTFRMYQLNLDGDKSRVYKEYWNHSAVHFIETDI